MSELGLVVIGRNEGDRLLRCLASIDPGVRIVYVDSGSSDGSVVAARDSGAMVVELNLALPFTAARARNAGRAALPSSCGYVQFVDGDCTLQPNWLAVAHSALEADPGLAAVFGRRREIAPSLSVYNWLCDWEWAVPPGPTKYFGGDVMLRLSAFDAAGGYRDEMIAGEEPDLAIRMRAGGWWIRCLPHEMTLHDAAISRFGQWRRRAQRSGHAYAELATRHRGSALQDYSRRTVGALFWGAAMPIAGLSLMTGALILGDLRIAAVATAVALLPLAQFMRIWLRESRNRPSREARLLATFLMLSKPAQSIGIGRYVLGRLSGRRSRIIEYKRSPA